MRRRVMYLVLTERSWLFRWFVLVDGQKSEGRKGNGGVTDTTGRRSYRDVVIQGEDKWIKINKKGGAAVK